MTKTKGHIIVRLIVEVDFIGDAILEAIYQLEKDGYKVSRGTDHDLIAEKKPVGNEILLDIDTNFA